ncbi:MAG: ankyrin repeat domain-containing protein, partial [Verrucomicrobia bacterium]|nr:ankyrin repeat domain-containing protein [Verrucomicrobiota bacterium]
HGANPNARNKSGATPLMSAVLSNNGQNGLDVVSVLLQYKADPNLPDLDGSTPLLTAINQRFVPMVKALLAGGANPDTRRRDGYPPLVLAVAVNNSGDKDMVAALISAKADVNTADSEGKTPLHWAVDNNRPDLVELLVKAGADVNARTKHGATPLNYAKTSSSSSGQGFLAVGVPGAPLSYQWQLSTAGSATTNVLTVADILHQNGALDELPDFTRIRITRQGLSSPIEVFQKASKLTNQFTLLETVMRFYARSSVAVPGVGTRDAWLALPFPDFGRIIIHRPGQKIGKEQEISVNLLNQSNIVDCAQDVPVQFGDVIEIPESVHALNADQPNPVGEMEGRALTFADRMRNIQALAQGGNKQVGVSDLNDNPYRPAAACLQKTVQLHVSGDTAVLKVDSWNEGFLSQALNKTEARSILRTSSDLSRVKVTRKTGKSASPVAFTVDLSQNDNPFWLQDGDVIEVPQKQ